jgi:hypothetical protein
VVSACDEELSMARKAAFITLAIAICTGEANAQQPNDFHNLFGNIVRFGMVGAAQSEWRRLPPSEIGCIERALVQQGVNVQNLIQRGIMPADSRLGQVRASCRTQNPQQPQPVASQNVAYVVDGLVLGGRVAFESSAYREYQCAPSEQFAGFTWCHKQVQAKDRSGTILFSNSILHSSDGVAVYVNREIEPATFEPGEFEKEIARLSAKYGEQARVTRMPPIAGLDRTGIIAQWGKIELVPLDADSVATLASGKNVTQGLLVDFLAHFNRSASVGLPVYRIAGGPGYLWIASSDAKGRGTLRFLTADASTYRPPIVQPAATPEVAKADPT